MKKNLLLLFCLVSLSLTINAQTIYENDFEDGFGDVTMVDNDGNTPANNVNTYVDAWNLRDTDMGQSAVSVSWYSPPAAADDWLITPAIEIPEAGFSFIMDARAVDPNYADGYEIMVSTTDAELASFTSISTVTAENVEWTKRAVSLDDYAGETIHIAIVNNSFDKFLLIVDNLLVVKLKEKDIAADRMTNERWNNVGGSFSPVLLLKNNGSETVTSVDVAYDVDGTTYNETVTGLNITSFATGEVNVSESFDMNDARQYNVNYTFSNPNGGADDSDVDNAGSGELFAISTLPERTVVGEEGTGTWCPWCPRGEVNLKQAIEDHPNDFIGIAVHNGQNDPMVVAEYDDNAGFSAYPSMHTNRTRRNFDPADLEANFQASKNELNAFSVTLENNYDETTGKLEIVATGSSNISMNTNTFRFALVMTQNGMSGTSSQWAQANAYAGGGNGAMGGFENLPNPVPASQMVYDHVGVALPGGFFGVEGSIPTEITAGEEFSYTFEYTLPAGVAPDKMQSNVFILDGISGAIMNATQEYVKMPVSIFETPEEIASRVYPNPATDIAQVELTLEEASDVTITIVDVTGKVVASKNYGKLQGTQTFPINVADFNSGVYMIQISSEKGSSTKRLTVTK